MAILLAASTPVGGFRQRAVIVSVAGQSFAFRTAKRKSVLGRALAALPAGDPHLIDGVTSVEIELVDHDQWLTSCDEDALANGANLAMIGKELIQFGDAAPTGAGRFRLARLLRGRGGTEWATAGHQSTDPFVLVGDGRTATISLPQWVKGASATAATESGPGDPVTMLVGGETLRPPAPAHLQGGVDGSGNLSLSWIRRSRRGWAWLDEVDAPLGETAEQYRVTVVGSVGSMEASSSIQQIVIPLADLAGAGSGAATVEVRQIGDFAVSRPASISVILS